MGFITVPDMKRGNGNSSLLKFRLAFNRFDFGTRKSVTDFLTVTAFGKMADRIYSDIENNLNYICCFCDVRVSKYNSKTGVPVEHTEFIVNDCRVFAKPKAEFGAGFAKN
jgi:single-stranded DNA-binding protein